MSACAAMSQKLTPCLPLSTYDKESPIYTVVVFGASGDLATKKVYPNLWTLYRDSMLPDNINIVGFARSNLTIEDVKMKCTPFIKLHPSEAETLDNFWKLQSFICGKYDNQADLEILNNHIESLEVSPEGNRLLYLALPPTIFQEVTSMVKQTCMSSKGWTRIIIEKPFGKDSESSQKLNNHLTSLFKEEQIYRIDHYLGKEMVINIMTIRFGNKIFGPIWNREHVASVLITFKEDKGTAGRAGYFNEFGILRDVMQNHLLQILAIVAMEKPATCEPDDIRDEKVKILKKIPPLIIEDVVLGQFVGDPQGKGEARIGYLDEPGIPKNSNTPTYAAAVLRIMNERWEGVPFILKCGKGLNEQKAEVRIQFEDVLGDIFDGILKRNELVLRVQPGEAIYLKMMIKSPGRAFEIEETELDMTFSSKFKSQLFTEAYERLILDVFTGSQMHFVRSDELVQAWRIFTPLLHKIETENIKPIPYVFGSRGPKEADDLIHKNNFLYTGTYKWYNPSKHKKLV